MKHTFIISIDDGDCQYHYPITIPDGDMLSIRDIYLTLCKQYNVEPKDGIYCKSKMNSVCDILDIQD